MPAEILFVIILVNEYAEMEMGGIKLNRTRNKAIFSRFKAD